VAATANAMLTIAWRDVQKFLHDRARVIGTVIGPLLFIGAFGGALQSNLGQSAGFNLLLFTFTGVFAQTIFQSTVTGLTSLIEDRENDFAQELFIAPISRYAIVFGKILGESAVAFLQGLVTVLFGVIAFGVPLSAAKLLPLLPVGLVICIFGGSFGLLLMSLFSSQRSANQIIPFLIFPQFFLAGVFTPIRNLPWYLDIASRISPLRYAVDLARGAFYAGDPDYDKIVLTSPLVNLAIMAILFVVFMVVGTTMFVRSEKNR
jgi:ABC-2 type transport system permease protein